MQKSDDIGVIVSYHGGVIPVLQPSPDSVSQTAHTCAKCGAGGNVGTFCSYCGTSLVSTVAPVPVVIANAPASEKTFLEEGGAFVTNTRVIIHGQTYAMANITSVKMMHEPANLSTGNTLLVGTIIAFCIALMTHGALSILTTLGAGGLMIYAYRSAKPTYYVILGTAGGEARALSSQDKMFVGRVSAALSQAMVHRG